MCVCVCRTQPIWVEAGAASIPWVSDAKACRITPKDDTENDQLPIYNNIMTTMYYTSSSCVIANIIPNHQRL